jgi:hypothetical protein
MAADYARITDQMVARARAEIGVQRHPRNGWNTEASKDGINHWAWGVGDDNPLWLSDEYAAKGPYGVVVAPPSYLYSVDHGPMGPGSKPAKGKSMPGIHGLHLYDDWEFFEPLKLGQKLSAVEQVARVDEKMGRFSNRMVLQDHEVLYSGSDGRLMARKISASMKTERGESTKSVGKYDGIGKWVYSQADLDRIDRDYENERPRGAETRYWDDVSVGDDMGHVTKGPLTVIGMITFWMGWGCIFGMTDKIAHDFIRLHPRSNIPHDDTNVPDFPERAHWAEDNLVHDIGFPLGYDIGCQRISWFVHLATNWQGDTGFLRKLRVSLRSPNWLGDTTWIRGRVVGKQVVAGEHLVDCELYGESQRGIRHSEGTATIRLPARGA